MSSNKTGANYSLETLYPEEEDYLMDHEKKLLKGATEKANRAQAEKRVDFLNISLNEILRNWSNSMQEILRDLSKTMDVNNYILESENAYEFVTLFFDQIWEIFTKNDRLIYVGLTFIFISFVIYFINVSS